jgi:hypothetical protein
MLESHSAMTELPPTPPPRFSLRDLSLSARLVLSLFLVSTGIGYFSALVQLHFQHARAGELLPSKEDAAETYHGTPGMSTLERLIRADESKPFDKFGTMKPAFSTESIGWDTAVTEKAAELKIDEEKAEKLLRKERDREVAAVLWWIKAGASKPDYEKCPLPKDFFKELDKPLEEKPFIKGANESYYADVSQIIRVRCARCHSLGKRQPAGAVHLNTWEGVKVYLRPPTQGGSSGMSLKKLAQTTHIHLLGFSMLYGLTGLILAFSSYPCWLKVILCPLPLLAQIIDIGCWWMARFDPIYAHFILYTGGVVAVGLMLHIVLSLLNMYGVTGKLVLLLLFIGAAGGGFVLKTQIVDPHLISEKRAAPVAPEP